MHSNNESLDREALTFIERARRAQIIDSAIAAIAELGYGKASMAEIAKRAATSAGTVAYHFTRKDDLIEAVVVSIYLGAGEAIESRLAAAATPPERLAAYVTANLEYIRTHSAQVRALSQIVVNFRKSDGTLRYGPSDNNAVTTDIEQILIDGQTAGVFRDFSTRNVSITIRAAIDTASGRLAADDSFDIDAYAHDLLQLIESGIRREP